MPCRDSALLCMIAPLYITLVMPCRPAQDQALRALIARSSGGACGSNALLPSTSEHTYPSMMPCSVTESPLGLNRCQYLCCHRAIDDVYVLCELECSMRQTRYVIQQLDEATVDFRKVCAPDCGTPGMTLAGMVPDTLTRHVSCTVLVKLSCASSVKLNRSTAWCSA